MKNGMIRSMEMCMPIRMKLEAGAQPARIQDAVRIECCLDAAAEAREWLGLRGNDVDRGPQRFRGAQQHPRALRRAGRRLDRSMGSGGSRPGDPDKAATPIEVAPRTERICQGSHD